MTFGGAFVPTFSGVFDRGGATRPWWNPGGTFTAVAAYQAKGAASLSASYTNLVNSATFAITENNAPGWASGTGWDFRSGGRLSVNSNNAWGGSGYTFMARIDVTGAGGGNAGRVFNADDGANYVFLIPRNATTNPVSSQFSLGGLGTLTVTQTLSGDLVIGMAGTRPYLNGASLSGTISPGTLPTSLFYIGNRFDNARALGGYIYAFAVYSSVLDATQVATLTTQMNAL